MTQSKFLSKARTVAVVPVPFSGGQPRNGVDEGPTRLLEFGIIDQIKELGWGVDFSGEIGNFEHLRPQEDPDIGNMKNPRFVSRVTCAVAKIVELHAKKRNFVLTLGGDHSLGLSTVFGTLTAYPDACVVWVDAHADINTPETTDTGNLHGCPLSFLTGIASEIPEFDWVKPCLPTNRLVYIGLRDVDSAEKEILKKYNIKAFSMHEVDKYGIGQVVEMALDHVNPNRDRPIRMSFDVDALDPSIAPSTGTPVRGGLTFREGHYICEALYDTGCLVATDIVEVNPTLEDEASSYQTVSVGCSLARCALGETLL